VYPLNCLTKGFTPTVLVPSCTKTVPKPYPIVMSGLTSSEGGEVSTTK
jgi:hypothetical protein